MGPKDSYSKFEKVRIVSARALQISQGSPLMIDLGPEEADGFDPTNIALKEWEAELIPIDIKRESKKKRSMGWS
ncbi:MAG: DNA-directed RNA polymerase subunit K [Candidatus Aenigmarchaeota archaeon]|nr:DNA-directed RNA polymerase subunit K [Candidatus Aenigmarchaeota archaeon]